MKEYQRRNDEKHMKTNNISNEITIFFTNKLSAHVSQAAGIEVCWSKEWERSRGYKSFS